MIAEQKRILKRVLLCIFAVLLFTACGSKSSKVLETINLGQKYLSEENYTEAAQAFTEAIDLGSESVLAYMGRADAYAGMDQYEEAKKDYENAVAKSENQPLVQAEAYVKYAEICEKMGDSDAAKLNYEAAEALLKGSNVQTGEEKDNLLKTVEQALSETNAAETENGPQELQPLPLASVQSPLEDGDYDASFDCANAISGNNLKFQVYGCYYYDAGQVENLKPGDTISGQYDYFYDDAKFTMQVEEVSSLEGIESRWISGKMQDEYSDSPYEQELYLIKDGTGYFITMDNGADRTWGEKKDFRPIGDANEKMAENVVLTVTPLGQAKTVISGIDDVKKVIAANSDSWWMVGSLTITVKQHQITEIRYIEHNDEEDYDAGESSFVMPNLTGVAAGSTAEKIDLSGYIGKDLHEFLAAHPELSDVGATDGEEYTDHNLTVGASYGGSKIDFVDLSNKCGYTIAGIECGMSREEAARLAGQKYGTPSDSTENYESYTIDDAMSTSLGIRIQNGKVWEVSISSELNLYE